ncbi:MAG: glycerate kinase [Anaerolineaceae bacterium]|nr:glycerate kinase [Anaerolineaceae bacterium]
MKILVAPNAFKGSLSAKQAAQCIANGLIRSALNAEPVLLPIADGGDGTLDAFMSDGGQIHSVAVLDPLQRERVAEFGVLPDGDTAIVEMARASGFTLLKPTERNPLQTTSYGTGQLLAAASALGCQKIILGVGGSATVDGGAGALQALKVQFMAADGSSLPMLVGGRLQEIAAVDRSALSRTWRKTQLVIATDVDNPVLGKRGAAAVFAPQKGATPQQVKQLEEGLQHFFALIEMETGRRVTELPGSGAAGALAGGLIAVLGGQMVSGISLLLDHHDFVRRLEDADLLITGEGSLDRQTLAGKAPLGVARLARQAQVPTVALVGDSDWSADQGKEMGFDAIIRITPRSLPLREAFAQAPQLLEHAAHRLGEALESGAIAFP